jgi:hypothetical protein
MTFINPNVAILAGAAAKAAKPESPKSRQKNATEKTTQLGREYVQIVQRAQSENPDNHPETIQQTKELLLKGHFDTAEAAREAAEKIADYGI